MYSSARRTKHRHSRTVQYSTARYDASAGRSVLVLEAWHAANQVSGTDHIMSSQASVLNTVITVTMGASTDLQIRVQAQ